MHILTLFDYSRSPIRPFVSLTDDGIDINFYTFLIKGTGKNLYTIFKKIENFILILESRQIQLNDTKSHIEAFGLENRTDYELYDLAIDKLESVNDIQSAKLILLRTLKSALNGDPKVWQRLLSNAMSVYSWLENRGLYDGYSKLDFRFDTTSTGRSKTLGFNVQGTTEEYDLRIDPNRSDYYVHLDWISADIRALSLLSGDKEMQESFVDSDPYQYMSDILENKISRDKCKIKFLRPLYQVVPDEPIFGLFPQMQTWMRDKISQAKDTGYIESILGRRFQYNGENLGFIFSGMIQGTVAHAMQNVLINLYNSIPENILTETHDSVTLMCNEKDISKIISKSKDIMLRPFAGLLNQNPTFPFKVYIGDRWKSWKVLKEYR